MVDIETILQIKEPSYIAWSSDSNKLMYLITGLSGSNIMVTSLASDTSQCLVTDLPPPSRVRARAQEREHRQELRWSDDGKQITFNRKFSYFTVPVTGGEPEMLISGKLLGERVQLSPDAKYISFFRDGDLWIKPVAGGDPRQLTEGEELFVNPVDQVVGEWPKWAPDGTKIGFASVYRERWKYNLGIVSLENDGVKWIAPSYHREWQLKWSPDGQKVALTRVSYDEKWRELLIASATGDEVHQLWRDEDARWVSREDFGAAWSHDNRKLAFVSNRDGWNHLYVASLDGSEPKKLTEGDYDIIFDNMLPGAQWSPDDSELVFMSNRGSLQENRLWIVSAAGGEARKLIDMKGICTDFRWSPDGKYIAFAHSGPSHLPGLWLVEASGESDPLQLYSSRPAGMNDGDMANMEAVKYKSTDGASIPAVLMTPKDLNQGQKYPAIIYMYGWQSQWAKLGYPRIYPYQFFNYLVQKGYAVLMVDPRGSWGYGKEHEIAIHLDPGGQHADDVVAGAKYLAGLEYIDPERIGITGISGGGFMTVQNLIRFPEVYAAGVEEVGAFSWKDYYDEFHQTWALPRLGVPEQHPDIYERSHLYIHVDRIQAPLLMLAGTEDVNVLWSHAVKMVDALVQAGKEFDFMIYPGEPHRWTKVEVWRDALKRIERFWDTHLKFKKHL